jgi:hypothetical protein
MANPTSSGLGKGLGFSLVPFLGMIFWLLVSASVPKTDGTMAWPLHGPLCGKVMADPFDG